MCTKLFFLLLLLSIIKFLNVEGCNKTFHKRSGTFSSPSFTGKDLFQAKKYCEWRIVAAPEEKIILNITNLNIKKTLNCDFGYVEVRDGYWYQSALLGKFCGQGQLDLLTSSGNKMFISYLSTSSQELGRLTATYEVVCGGEIFVENSTKFVSPNFPENYPLNKKCVWKIIVPEKNNVFVRFEKFNLENHSSCAFDYLEVRDGYTEESNLIGTYCSNELPPEILSSGNFLYIKFVSDTSVRKSGFSATIFTNFGSCATRNHGCAHKCVDIVGGFQCSCRNGFYLSSNEKDCETCGGVISSNSGTIKSPSFPNKHHPNATCVWDIVTSSEMNAIMLNFTRYDLENGNLKYGRKLKCLKNRLEIFSIFGNNTRKLQGVYCGQNGPGSLIFQSNKIRIVFTSNSSERKTGFSLDYIGVLNKCSVNNGNCKHGCINVNESSQCVCQKNYTSIDNGLNCFDGDCNYEISSFKGEISSPHYPSSYPPNKKCSWLFTTTPGHKIYIDFKFFSLEPNNPDYSEICSYDYVAIYDNNNSLVDAFCDTLPAPVTSKENMLYLTFSSDNDNEFQGFLAEHSTICGGTFLANFEENFIYSHVNFVSSDYDNGTDCEWIILTPPGSSVTLTFVTFQLEDSDECSDDYVEVIERKISNESLGTYCGSVQPPTLEVTGTVYIRFHSDDIGTDKGFRLMYKALSQLTHIIPFGSFS